MITRCYHTIMLYNELPVLLCSKPLLSLPRYGRLRMQSTGFLMMFGLFFICGVAFPTLVASSTGLRTFQALYFLSSFWNQVGGKTLMKGGVGGQGGKGEGDGLPGTLLAQLLLEPGGSQDLHQSVMKVLRPTWFQKELRR